MVRVVGNLLRMPAQLYRYRGLLVNLIHRELYGRVNGSVLGMGWLVLQPLLMLGMYTLVFGVFMKARWGQGSGVGNFALSLFPGLLVFNIFAECVNRAAGLITQNPNYVKKVVFPLELLIFPIVVSAFVQFLIGFVSWIVLVVLIQESIPWSLLLTPIYLLPYLLFIFGVCWGLSAIGVYFRDLLTIVPLVTQVLMFLSPVLYPIENIPEKMRTYFNLNPLTMPVESVRAAAFHGVLPELSIVIVYGVLSLLVAICGLKIFMSLRPGFSDVV